MARRTVRIDGPGWVRRDMGGLSLRGFKMEMGLSLPVQTLLNWDNGKAVSIEGLCRYLGETGAEDAVMAGAGGFVVRVERS